MDLGKLCMFVWVQVCVYGSKAVFPIFCTKRNILQEIGVRITWLPAAQPEVPTDLSRLLSDPIFPYVRSHPYMCFTEVQLWKFIKKMFHLKMSLHGPAHKSKIMSTIKMNDSIHWKSTKLTGTIQSEWYDFKNIVPSLSYITSIVNILIFWKTLSKAQNVW